MIRCLHFPVLGQMLVSPVAVEACDRQPMHRMMTVPSDEPSAKRRKVRKGTQSCWECRRRKVKCTFLSQDDAVCINCHRRSTRCISQATSDVPETAGSDIGDAEQNAAVNPRVVSESSARSQPHATVGCLPPTLFVIHTTPVSSVHSEVSISTYKAIC
jgi:hypothetical protein